jgi:hypothetical protein
MRFQTQQRAHQTTGGNTSARLYYVPSRRERPLILAVLAEDAEQDSRDSVAGRIPASHFWPPYPDVFAGIGS